jgi:hypothetical protein
MSKPILRIDDPEDRVLRQPMCLIRGWCAGADWTDIERLEFQIGDANLPWHAHVRPDVAAEHTGLWVTGFTFDLDLSQYLYAIRSSELAVKAVFPRAPEIELQFFVAPGVTADCLAEAVGI